MAIVIALLILLAVVYFILIGSGPPSADKLAEPAEDVATPYLEGLEASFRIQQAAWIAEQQIWAEAARHRSPGGLPNAEPDRRA
jgi:cytochrome oxidase Cu insertion factor (SCO1/SenC/PrrC family)